MKKIHPMWHIAGLIIFLAISLTVVITALTAKPVNFLMVGSNFSDVKDSFNDNFTVIESAGGRLTYSFQKESMDLTNIAVKDDIIEIVEVYTNFDNPADALELYESVSIHLVGTEECKLSNSYNTTLEFRKNNILVRVEQLPTAAGWLIKYTALLE